MLWQNMGRLVFGGFSVVVADVTFSALGSSFWIRSLLHQQKMQRVSFLPLFH